MSLTETPAPAPKPRRKRHARPNKRPAAAAPKPPSEMAGITVFDCPTACNADRCVISGMGVCAHPRKGGLHAKMMQSQDTIRRFNEATRMVGSRSTDVAR